MAKKIFISATGQNSGKTTTSLSLLHLARQKYSRIGFIKPIGPKPILVDGRLVDKDPAMIAQVYGLEKWLEWMCPVVVAAGTTQQVLDGEVSPRQLEEKILGAVERLDKDCDFLIIEGAGHSGVGSVIGLSNARVAALLRAPVMMIAGGGVGNVIDAVELNLALYRQEGAEVRLLVANKLIPEKREKTLHYLRLAFAGAEFQVMGGFNYQPILANPTLRRISDIVGEPLQGDQSALNRIVHHVAIGAPSTQRVVDLLQPSTLLLVTSSRDELLVTLANLYSMPEYSPNIAGLIVTGVAPVSRITQQIIDRSKIPYVRTTQTTADIFITISEDVSKLTAADQEKIALIQELSPKRFDFEVIDQLFSR